VVGLLELLCSPLYLLLVVVAYLALLLPRATVPTSPVLLGSSPFGPIALPVLLPTLWSIPGVCDLV
jgi:hypothetical protein